MSVDTMARLFELKNIAGVKDATADLNRVDEQLKKIQLLRRLLVRYTLILKKDL